MIDKVKMSLEKYEGLKMRIADLQAEVERKDEEYRVLESKCQWFEEVFDMLLLGVQFYMISAVIRTWKLRLELLHIKMVVLIRYVTASVITMKSWVIYIIIRSWLRNRRVK